MKYKKKNTILSRLSLLILFFLFSFMYNCDVFASTYSASLTTSGSISLDVSSAGNGANVISDELNVISTCPYGYDISISGPADTALYKDGDNTSDDKIDSSSGTIAAPVTILNANRGTWGYSTTSSSINGNFTGLTSSATTIKSSNTATPTTGTALPVYYGASVPSNLAPGTYTMAESTTGAGDNVITYYLTTPLNCTSYQVAFNPTSTAGNTTISGTGTMSNQYIDEGVATPLEPNGFTAPSGYKFKEWNTSQDGTGTSYNDEASVTDLTTLGNTITLYAQWEDMCASGAICYYNFHHDYILEPEKMMDDQYYSSSTTIFKAPDSDYDYGILPIYVGFGGWNTEPDGSGTDYGPNQNIDQSLIGTIQSEGLILYAHWIESSGDMQDWSGCDDLELYESIALTDIRATNNQAASGHTYTITKLDDGQCWMTENLRLGEGDHEPLSQGYDHNSFRGLAQPENPWPTNATTTNSLYTTGNDRPIVIDTWNSPGARFPRYNDYNTGNTTGFQSNLRPVYNYGNYYTWPAAVASSAILGYDGAYGSVNESSICPSGWRLPQGGDKNHTSSNDYWNLIVDVLNEGTLPSNFGSTDTPKYDGNEAVELSNLLRSVPYNFVFSGKISGTNSSNLLNSLGTSGGYFTSTYSGMTNAFSMTLSATDLYPGDNLGPKSYGRAIRCISAPVPSATISYLPNAVNVPDTMDDQAVYSSDETIELWASNFQRHGYGFAGWNTEPDGTGTYYGPNERINNSPDFEDMTLYAQWVEVATDNNHNELTFQTNNLLTTTLSDGTTLNSKPVGYVTALKDYRDNQVYAVAKLADGKYWMIENLRLDSAATVGNNINDSTITNASLSQGYASGFIGLATAETNTFGGLEPNSLYSTSSFGSDVYPSARFPRYSNENYQSSISLMTNANQNIYSYGGYYTWHASIANIDLYTQNNTTINNTSICPAGWRLPSGGDKQKNSSNDYMNLAIALTGALPANNSTETIPYYTGEEGQNASNAFRLYPNNFITAGFWGAPGNPYYRGRAGHYRTSTNRDNLNAYEFTLGKSNVYPGTAYDGVERHKHDGLSVRCLINQ